MNEDNVNLTQAMIELEKMTREFDSGQVDLEQGIPKFKRGLQLARLLNQKLTEIENEIEEIKAEFAAEEPPTPAKESASSEM